MLAVESNEPTVGLPSARALIERFFQHGISTETLADYLGISVSLLEEEDARLPLSVFHRMWEHILDVSGDPTIGLTIAREEDAHALGIVAHVVFNSPTLGQGMEQYIRLFSVVNEAIEVDFERGPEHSRIRFTHKYTDYYSYADMERTLAIAIGRTQRAVNIPVKVFSVSFQHSAPDDLEPYNEYFNCELKFDQPYCEIVFASEILDRKPKRGNPHMGAATLQYANRLLSRLFKRKIAHKVRRLVEAHLGDEELDANKAAALLNMSRPTLYRKLKQDGLSYSEIVDEVKSNKAKVMLLQTQAPLSVIAYDLGFSEVSAFARAFKRWTGQTPAQYRAENQSK